MVPDCQPLVEGHCYIVPMTHVSSCLQLDEDIYDEMQVCAVIFSFKFCVTVVILRSFR